jgi:hypothetical protein
VKAIEMGVEEMKKCRVSYYSTELKLPEQSRAETTSYRSYNILSYSLNSFSED